MEKTKQKINYFYWVDIVIYLYIAVIIFLFFSERYGRDLVTQQYNLQPFKEIKRFIRYRGQIGWEGFIVNIFGNIIAFMPYGFLLPLLNKAYRRFYIILILCVLFSLAVETAQLLLKVGVFDIDDILLNSFGGILGYLYFIIHSIYRRRAGR